MYFVACDHVPSIVCHILSMILGNEKTSNKHEKLPDHHCIFRYLISKRLRFVEKYISFEFAALFYPPFRHVEKRGKLKMIKISKG